MVQGSPIGIGQAFQKFQNTVRDNPKALVMTMRTWIDSAEVASIVNTFSAKVQDAFNNQPITDTTSEVLAEEQATVLLTIQSIESAMSWSAVQSSLALRSKLGDLKHRCDAHSVDLKTLNENGVIVRQDEIKHNDFSWFVSQQLFEEFQNIKASVECTTCSGHGNPSQSWQPGKPCNCVCDQWFAGPTCADLHIDGYYRIVVQEDNRLWHGYGDGNWHVGTDVQEETSFSSFHIAKENGHNTYTIRLQALQPAGILHWNCDADQEITTNPACQQDSIWTRYKFEHRPEHGGTFTIRLEANNQNLHADDLGDYQISTRVQEDSGFTRFHLKPISVDQDLMV